MSQPSAGVLSHVSKWHVSDNLVSLTGSDSDSRDLMLMGMVYPGWVEFLGVQSKDTETPAGPNLPSRSNASVKSSTDLPFSRVDRATGGVFEPSLIRDKSMSSSALPITLREPTR